MKEQTFGVEVEMNNIKRNVAAEVAAKFFGTGRYSYVGTCYRTWSAWDAEDREWKFSRDSSICGPDDEKCEMITPILTYKDMELLQELIRRLRKAGAQSDAKRGCGIHIHIGASGHTPQSLRNLTNIMAAHEELISKALDLDAFRLGMYCKPVDPRFVSRVNAEKPKTMAELAEVWYTANGASYGRDEHYNDSRYHMLNLHATFTKGTIEFRLFQFDAPTRPHRSGLHAGKLKAYIQFCLALSDMAKRVRTANPTPQQTDNPKYAMRTWLLRLGFVGDEFATARKVFTDRLAGNAAWRHIA